MHQHQFQVFVESVQIDMQSLLRQENSTQAKTSLHFTSLHFYPALTHLNYSGECIKRNASALIDKLTQLLYEE